VVAETLMYLIIITLPSIFSSKLIILISNIMDTSHSHFHTHTFIFTLTLTLSHFHTFTLTLSHSHFHTHITLSIAKMWHQVWDLTCYAFVLAILIALFAQFFMNKRNTTYEWM
jgi:hypothetical protein